MINPKIIDTSEMMIAIATVCLKLLPTGIEAAIGTIIKAEINKTPTISMNRDIETAKIMVIMNWNPFTFKPLILANSSSKHTRMN